MIGRALYCGGPEAANISRRLTFLCCLQSRPVSNGRKPYFRNMFPTSLHQSSKQFKGTGGVGYCRPKGKSKIHGRSNVGSEEKYIERTIEFLPENLSGRLLDVRSPIIQKSAIRGQFLDDFPWLSGRPIRFELNKEGRASGTACACQVSYWLWMNKRILPTPALAKKILTGLKLVYGRGVLTPQ